jgi:ferredoxin
LAKRINQERCIRCGACIPECPNEGIAEQDGEITIDSGLCTECYGFASTSQCVQVCPVEAIEPVPDVMEDEDDLIGLAAALHPEKFPRS